MVQDGDKQPDIGLPRLALEGTGTRFMKICLNFILWIQPDVML